MTYSICTNIGFIDEFIKNLLCKIENLPYVKHLLSLRGPLYLYKKLTDNLLFLKSIIYEVNITLISDDGHTRHTRKSDNDTCIFINVDRCDGAFNVKSESSYSTRTKIQSHLEMQSQKF